MNTTIRRIGVTLVLSAGTFGALATTSAAHAILWELDHDAATSYSTADRENAIAACMADRGFDYVPWIGTTTGTPVVFPGDDGPQHAILWDFDGPEVDPNETIVDALSVEERIDYQHALYGDLVNLDADGHLAGTTLTSTDEGCA